MNTRRREVRSQPSSGAYHAGRNKTTKARTSGRRTNLSQRLARAGGSHRRAVDRIACGIDEPCGYEDEQVALGALRDLAAEEAADHGYIAEERHLVIDLLQLFRHQPAENDCLT